MAPPLVSHGFGGDGADMSLRGPPHRAVVRFGVGVVDRTKVEGDAMTGTPATSKGWEGNWRRSDPGKSCGVGRLSLPMCWAVPRRQ